MIPGESLINGILPHGWRERMKTHLPSDMLLAYEVGGAEFQGGSPAIDTKQWYARVQYRESPEAWLLQIRDEGGEWLTVLERLSEVTEIDLAWDGNMNVFFAFVEDKETYIHWYNSLLGEMVTTHIADAKSPRCCTDDKRPSQTQSSDIIVSYLKGGDLYYRQQRDRFEVEKLLATGLGDQARIVCMGMSNNLRLQWQLVYVGE